MVTNDRAEGLHAQIGAHLTMCTRVGDGLELAQSCWTAPPHRRPSQSAGIWQSHLAVEGDPNGKVWGGILLPMLPQGATRHRATWARIAQRVLMGRAALLFTCARLLKRLVPRRHE